MRNTSFNIFHLAVVALIVMVLIAVLFPIMRSQKRDRNRSWHSTQLRGIHQGLVTYANSNKNWYPGINFLGEDENVSVEMRFQILLEAEMFTPEYAISPSETDSLINEWLGVAPVTKENYSYAMLQIPTQGERRAEWRQTLNSQAIVLSDRNTSSSAYPRSVHTKPGDNNWLGSVLWNDNHVAFENTNLFETKYGESKLIKLDDLFHSSGDDDAYLIHTGN